jgi:hypothetical protein
MMVAFVNAYTPVLKSLTPLIGNDSCANAVAPITSKRSDKIILLIRG